MSRKTSSANKDEDCLQHEEKRRTFWMAYSLDLFLGIRGRWPPTLHEYNVRTFTHPYTPRERSLLNIHPQTFTRLPVPEDIFQSSHTMEMPFLSDSEAVIESSQRSATGESITIAATCRNLAAHRQRAEEPFQATSEDLQVYWEEHARLDYAVKIHLNQLQRHYSAAQRRTDSLLLFTAMMAHTITLCLYATMAAIASQVGDDHRPQLQDSLAAFRQQAALAARSILELSRSLAHLSCLKVS